MMRYIDSISSAERGKYEIIENWNYYLQSNPKDHHQLIYDGKSDFRNKIFKDKVHIPNAWGGSTSFDNCYFTSGFSFDGKLNQGLDLVNCFIDGILYFNRKTDVLDNISIHKCKIRNLFLDGASFNYLEIESTEIESMKLIGCQFKKMLISSVQSSATKIGNCFIDPTNLVGTLVFEEPNTSVQYLSICGNLGSSASIVIDNPQIGILDLFSLRNNGSLRLRSIRPIQDSYCIVHISHCNLGKTEFYDFNLSAFGLVLIGMTQIVDCVFLNTEWPKAIYANVYGNTKEQNNSINDLERRANEIKRLDQFSENWLSYHHQRETYRQIKYALSKQGDSINEQHFHVLEMLAYDNSLEYKNALWTKLIIKCSYYSSEFGQSFIRPLSWLIILHLLWFSIANSTQAIVCKGGNQMINQFFLLINPLHKIENGFFNDWTIIWDVLMRITSSYMLYNIIRATRRFIK